MNVVADRSLRGERAAPRPEGRFWLGLVIAAAGSLAVYALLALCAYQLFRIFA